MQVSGQNNAYIPQMQYNGSAVTNPANGYINPAGNLRNQVNGVPAQPQQAVPVTPTANGAPQPCYYQPQINVPPNANGVNIQIFNPTVSTPGAQSHNNVNAPNYYCYPPNYYTSQPGADNGTNQAGNINGSANNAANANAANAANAANSANSTTSTQTDENSQKKTKKKRVVVLDDNYIRNLENYLNSPDKTQRLNAAKQVFERLDEDPSRKDDKALTALVNKMLQDPSQEIRLLALSALDGRICNGDQLTVQLLQQMQAHPKDYGFDASDASKILLDMSAKTADKEVPVDPDKRTTVKKEVKTEEKKDEKKSQIKSNN